MFRRGGRNWDRVGKIRLPETVLFEDYSGIAVTGDRIAVISQVSSALWLGHLAPDGWQVTGAGTTYALPRDADGNIVYGTAEGVSWIAPDQVVMCLGQGQARAGPPVPGKGPVHPHLPYSGPGPPLSDQLGS